MNFFGTREINSIRHVLDDGRIIVFDGFWEGFQPTKDCGLWVDLLPKFCTKPTIRVLGPFWRPSNREKLDALRSEFGVWDYFLTGENRDNCTDLAEKCIGFRLPRTTAEIRFPYWQWYLTWQGYETAPKYERFGERLSIENLMRPIQDVFSTPSRDEFEQFARKAVLVTSHFKRHRRRLWRLTDKVMGCDAFGRKIQPTSLHKKDLLEAYYFNLCPENRLGEGYITEKIPEAFLCGCVPITYCHPDDLALDFNPAAIINLYGLSKRQALALLQRASGDYEFFQTLRSEPLVLERPSMSPLLNFLAN